jgi:hypothetical protein
MSAFSGRQGKGAKRIHRETKRAEAEQRQDVFDAEVLRVMFEQNVERKTARFVVMSRLHFERRRAAVKAATS